MKGHHGHLEHTETRGFAIPVPQMLTDEINALIAAIERDDLCVDCYENEVESCARKLNEEQDMWIRRYSSGRMAAWRGVLLCGTKSGSRTEPSLTRHEKRPGSVL